MTQKIDPFLQTKWGWSDGENAWGNGMNENLIKFSFLLNRRLDGIVGSISSTPASDGLAYFLTTDKHVYFSGDGVWYNTALPIGFELIMKADESHYEYNGTTLVPSSVSGVVAWADITGKPSTFTPSTHTHVISDVTGLQTALDAKVDKVGGKGLSTEDYTTAEKSKLAGIATGAEANTISSVGAGTASLVSGKVGVDLQIKSLVAGSNISFSQTGDSVTINSSTGGVGVVNSVNGYTGTVTLTNADLGSTPITRAITAGNGLTGGGDLSANRTLTLGTPSSISTASTNNSSAGTHSHLLVLSAADIGAVDLTTLNTRLGTSGNLGTLALQNSNAVTISGGTINGTPIGSTTRSTGNFTDIDINGNITASGAGKKFLADFTNATLANRFYFQTSTSNSTTSVGIAPNGTSQNANLLALNSSDLINASYIGVAAGPSSVNINSGARGSGTLLPINFNMGGIDAVIIDTNADTSVSGNLFLTGTGKRIKSDFSNVTIASRTLFQTTVANSGTRVEAIPSGTATTANFGVFNNSDPTNASYAKLTATSADVRVESTISGTGTYLPLNLYTSGNIQVSIALNGVATFTNSIVTSGSMNAATYSGAGVSVSAVGNTLVKRDVNGDVYSRNSFSSGYVQATGGGGFLSDTYVANSQNPIWRFASNLGVGISYFHGTAGQSSLDTIGFHFGTASIGGSGFKFRQDGLLTAVAFAGDGASVTGISASNISSGTLSNSRLAFSISAASSASTVVQRDGAGDIYANNGNFSTDVILGGSVRATGNLNGSGINLFGTGPTFNWGDTNSPATSMTQYISFRDNTNAEVGWFGYGAGNGEIAISNQSRNIKFYSPVVAQQNVDIGGTLTATNGVNFYHPTGSVANLNCGGSNGTILMQLGGSTRGYINWDSTGWHLLDANANSKLDITTTGASVVTQATGNNTTLIANTGFVQNSLANLNASNLTSGTVPTARLTAASTSVAGIVQLSDSTGSPSSTTAATSLAVNTAANTASTANSTANNAIARLNDQYASPYQMLNNMGSGSGARTIVAASGTHVKATCTGNTTWTFPSVGSSDAMALTLELTNGGVGTQTWPAGTLWAGGVQPTWTVSGKDRVVFTKAGTDPWLGALAGKGFA